MVTGRPGVDNEVTYMKVCSVLKENPCISFRDLCDEVNHHAATMSRFYHKARRSSEFSVWFKDFNDRS